jgi:creatinine amidohydrolase
VKEADMGYSIFDETMVDMTWPEIERAASGGAVVLLPTGIIEEHGPHLGLAVDTYVPYLISIMVRRELKTRGIEALIAPPCYWGVSAGTACFAGTFSVRPETMKAVIYDILASLHGWGLDTVFSINWHADYHHCRALLEAVREARRDMGTDTFCILTEADVRRLRLNGDEDYVLLYVGAPPMGTPGPFADLHAGSLETGIMRAYFPGQVKIEMAKQLPPTELTYRELGGLKGGDETRRLIPQGYFGNPAAFDEEAARRYVETVARDYTGIIADFVKGT